VLRGSCYDEMFGCCAKSAIASDEVIDSSVIMKISYVIIDKER
jgi:hypothetical protein